MTRAQKLLTWLLPSVAMYLSGARGLRRAALRGLVALASVASLRRLPLFRGRDSDGAMSGAFVTGAGLEAPFAALPLSALSLAVDRRSERGFWRRAIAILSGATVALVTKRFWPVPPEATSTAPKVWLPEHAEPNEGGDGLTIVVNADSGNGEPPTAQLRELLPKANVIEVEINQGDELRKALDQALSEGAIALGVAGGDGSINTAAQVALDAEKVLMVVPGGTFNHLGMALGVETVDDAVDAVEEGQAVGIDVSTIAGQVFLNTASFGSYVELVDARERLEHRVGKWPAVVIALVRVLRKSEPVEVELEGRPCKIWMAFIGNCRYHPSGFAPSWRERLDDGLLDFRYVSAEEPFARTRLILAVLTGRLGRSKIYRQACVENLHIRSLQGGMRLARDGETFDGPEEFEVEKLDKRLAVFVMHSKKS